MSISKKSKDVIHHLGPKTRQQNYQPNHAMYLSGIPSISVSPSYNHVLSSSQILLNSPLQNNLTPNSPALQPQHIFYSEAQSARMGGGFQSQNLIINQSQSQSQPQHLIMPQHQPQPQNLIIGQAQPQNLIMGQPQLQNNFMGKPQNLIIGQSQPQNFIIGQPQPQNLVMMQPQPQNFMIGQNQRASGLSSSQLQAGMVYADHVINGGRSVEYVPFEKTMVDVVPVTKMETITVPKVATDYIALERQIEYQPISRFETVKDVVPQMRTDYEDRVYEEVVPVSRTEYVPVDRVEERIEYTPIRRQRILSQEELKHSQIYREGYMAPPPLPTSYSENVIHHGTFYSEPLPNLPPPISYNERFIDRSPPPLYTEYPQLYPPPINYNERFIERPPPPPYTDHPQPYPPPYAFNDRFIESPPPSAYTEHPQPPQPPIGYKERLFERPPLSPLSREHHHSRFTEYDYPPPFQYRVHEYSHSPPYWDEFYHEGGQKYGHLPPSDIGREGAYFEKDCRPFNDRSYPPFNEFSGPYAKPFDRETFYNDVPHGFLDDKFRDKKERKWKGIDGRF